MQQLQNAFLLYGFVAVIIPIVGICILGFLVVTLVKYFTAKNLREQELQLEQLKVLNRSIPVAPIAGFSSEKQSQKEQGTPVQDDSRYMPKT